MRPSPPPTVGRIVHFLPIAQPSDLVKPYIAAAIITAVDSDDYASLTVFFEGETGFYGAVPPAPDMNDPQPGTWFYPPRV